MPSASTAPSATALPSPSPSLSSPSPATPKLRRILIANRGEIAMRVIHACHDTGRIAIYYGCADTVTGLCFTTVDETLNFLKAHNLSL